MTFDEGLDHVRALLQNRGRVAYRALKRRLELDDEYLENLKAELIKAEGVAMDEGGEVLVFTDSRVGSPQLLADSTPRHDFHADRSPGALSADL